MSLINEFSVQLYSIREDTAKDFAGSLRKLGEIGYTGVEFAGYGGFGAKEMKRMLSDAGLAAVSSHIGLDRLTDNLEAEIEYSAELGMKHMVCPGAQMKNRGDVLKLAEQMNAIAEKIRAAGMTYGYHNHYHEFAKDGGEFLMDILMANTCAECVTIQPDLYWIAYADVGINLTDYMRKYKGRVKLVHLKQLENYETKKCVDLGDGVIDFKEIIQCGFEIGAEAYILEQEEFAKDSFTSMKAGFDHIMSL